MSLPDKRNLAARDFVAKVVSLPGSKMASTTQVSPVDVNFGHWSYPLDVSWRAEENPNSRNRDPRDVLSLIFIRPSKRHKTFLPISETDILRIIFQLEESNVYNLISLSTLSSYT